MWAKGLTKQERDERQSKLDRYWTEAKLFVKGHGGEWHAFERRSVARVKWENYFIWRFGFVPMGLHYQDWGTIKAFLVPCEDPEDFDVGYSSSSGPTSSPRTGPRDEPKPPPGLRLKEMGKAWLDRSDLTAQKLLGAARGGEYKTQEQISAEARSRLLQIVGQDAFDKLPNQDK